MWTAIKAILGIKALVIGIATVSVVATLWGIFYLFDKGTLLWHSEGSVEIHQKALESVTKFDAKRRKKEKNEASRRDRIAKEAFKKEDAKDEVPESIAHFWNNAWN